MKALRQPDADDQVLLEAYVFIRQYCSILGPMIAFSPEDMSFLLTHLCKYVAHLEQTNVVLLNKPMPSKKGRKRARADLNVDVTDVPDVNPDVHAAAFKAISALLVTDPRSVTEQAYRSLVDVVTREVVRVNVYRNVMDDKCIYKQPGSRKQLYKLMQLLATYPVYPEHRPLHVALFFFAEAAQWDTFDVDYDMPTFCRKALLELELITDPVIAPKVLTPDAVTQRSALDEDAEADVFDSVLTGRSAVDDQTGHVAANSVAMDMTAEKAGEDENADTSFASSQSTTPDQGVSKSAVDCNSESRGEKSDASHGQAVMAKTPAAASPSKEAEDDVVDVSDDSADEVVVSEPSTKSPSKPAAEVVAGAVAASVAAKLEVPVQPPVISPRRTSPRRAPVVEAATAMQVEGQAAAQDKPVTQMIVNELMSLGDFNF